MAIVRAEPFEAVLAAKILGAPQALMAAPSYLEAHMVMRKYLEDQTEMILQAKVRGLGIKVVAFTPEHAAEAARAFDRFGKGRHPAGLNLGDCVSYALAQVSGQTLLFVGDDFSKTDVRIA